VNRFFASLAARAVGGGPRLQRRQSALFEPDTRPAAGRLGAPSQMIRMPAGDPGFEVLEREVEVTQRAPAGAPVRRRRVRERWDSGANAAEIGSPSGFPEEPVAVLGQAHTARVPGRGSLAPPAISDAKSPQRIESAKSVDSPTEPVRTDSAESRVFERVSHRDAQVVVERVRTEAASVRQRAAPRAEPAVALEPRGVLDRLEYGSGLNRDSRVQSALHERSTAPEPNPDSPYTLTPLSPPEMSRKRALTDSQSQRAPSAEDAPAPIHVTIGRIEVRAVLPTGTAPRGRRQPPPSLDDFLRRRGRGQP
jgi:hypothetical protein